MGRLRRRDLIPDDTPITATLKETKIVHGKFGRQVETKALVTKGEYKGTEFKDWFSFGRDEDTAEEFIPYGLALYQQFVKNAVKKLDGLEIMGRVGVKAPKNNPEKKRNCLVLGTFGPAEDPEAAFKDIPI